MVSVLVIGAGTMGTTHVSAYQQMNDVELVGIVDEDVERGHVLAKGRYPVFDSLDGAKAALKSVDMIDVCVPTPFHKECVIQASEFSANIICEKPLARNLTDAREMIEHCKSKKIPLFVGHVVRFFPEYEKAKDLIESGKIGQVGVVRTFRGGQFPQGFNNWYGDEAKSGGVLLDLVIHDFDFLRWVLGDVERVFAKKIPAHNGKDYALVTLRFANGSIAHVEGSWAHQGFSTSFEFAGRVGIVDYNSQHATSIQTIFTGEERSGSEQGVVVPESPLQYNPYYRELRHFLTCIQNGEEPIVTVEDAFKAVQISLAADESVKTGQAVELGKEGTQ